MNPNDFKAVWNFGALTVFGAGGYRNRYVESSARLKKPTRFDDVLVDHSVAASESVMAYSDFSLDQVKNLLGVTIRMLDLFPGSPPLPVPEWLT